ncbi:MAG: GAF domain-containing sensor histidine kinase [Ferruginibacter sp.]|nr:GAF domain-containing sensor histidine kinase [Cytophagales bacterium]
MPIKVVPGPMDQKVDLQQSQRLRYEAFSHFATEVNKASDVEAVGRSLSTHVKFMLDAFLLRVAYRYEQSYLFFEASRGSCTVVDREPRHEFVVFESALLHSGFPLFLGSEDIEQDPTFSGSLFDHPKLVSFYALPVRISPRHHLVISVGNKESSRYSDVDFRFLRLIGEVLSGKLSQLLLLRRVESKNEELEDANAQLTRLNNQIGELNQSLERTVAERTSDLRTANEELSILFYRTSHDFRRPLTTIMGLVQVAEMTVIDEEALQLFGNCQRVVVEMDAMLTKLSALGYYQSSYTTTRSLDFTPILGALRAKFAETAAKAGIDLRFNLYLKDTFHSDPAIILFILENLIENSIQFCGRYPYVELDVYQENLALVLRVADNGQGIEANQMTRIFEMYYRANAYSKGNGLGLYVVRKLVKVLGGEVEARSEVGRGSVFTVVLPPGK